MRSKIVMALIVMLAAATLASAQGNPTGAIRGAVSDPDGLALPGVTITVASPAMQGSRTVVTSANGDFIIPFLPPGEYTVTCELQGFAVQTRTIGVAMAETQPMKIQLALATVTETVTVTGTTSTEVLKTGTIAETYTAKKIDELPVGRTLESAVLLAPGVNSNGPERQHRHRRRPVVRGALPDQRREREREPPRSAAPALRRGRDPGDEGLDREHLGRVRPVQRRRRQHDHQVGRQQLQRLVPRLDEQRQLEGAQAAERLQARQGRLGLRGDPRRTDQAGQALVLHRRALHEERAGTNAALHALELPVRADRQALRGQGDVHDQPAEHRQGVVLGQEGLDDEQHVEQPDGPRQPVQQRDDRHADRAQLHQRAHPETVPRGAVLAQDDGHRRHRCAVHGPREGHADVRPFAWQRAVQLADVLRGVRQRLARGAEQLGRLRQVRLLPVHRQGRVALVRVRLRQLQGIADGGQLPVGERLPRVRHEDVHRGHPGQDHLPGG